eukprot:CAMPEP_0197660194 /NCGR_PEP_ID=MMETSP1338-20131121/50703_1 /TAXON_ID=43686 ORGANISM="Pelagodinium beii, Strain RCC1491" /NCGR_SAMPLE_ID=MMETSP1338 /ASSEMBLY_ACC=CAM_ASM_000754 /LENGTH=56 /DNA_ID=CAMNT_0043237497 /DNA_START=510 /DNA_END=680 /DNA_ORIENTATION=-
MTACLGHSPSTSTISAPHAGTAVEVSGKALEEVYFRIQRLADMAELPDGRWDVARV